MENEKKEQILNDFDKWYDNKKSLDEAVEKIDRQIKINSAVDGICQKIDNQQENFNKIDEKMIENAINEKGTIFLGGLVFHYNEEYNWYETSKEIDGKETSIHSYGLNDIENVLKLAVKYYEGIDLVSLKKCIVNEYYEKDKDTELNGISKEEFTNNLELLSIQVDSKYVEYWFDDNDMYGGHSIVITKKHDEEKITINLEG